MGNKQLCLVLLMLAALSACGRSAEGDLQAASEAMNNENYDKAIVLLKNIVRDNPQDIQSRYLLGKANLAIGDFASAEKNLDFAYRRGKQGSDVLSSLAMALYRNESYNELQDLLSDVDENSSTAQYYLGLSLRKLGKLELSNGALELAISGAGGYATLAKAVQAFNDGKIELALNLASESESALGVNSEATWLKTQILSVSERPEQAAEILELYVKEKTYDFRAKLLLAVELIRSKQYKAAEPIVNDFMRNNKNNGFLNELKGYIVLAEKGEKEALPLLMNAYQMGRKSSALALTTANAAYKLKQYETAHRFLTLINLDEIEQVELVSQLRLRVALKLGYTDEALSIYTNSGNEKANINDALVAELGYQLNRSGNPDKANDLARNFTLDKAKENKFLSSVLDSLNGQKVSFEELSQASEGDEDETVLLLIAALQKQDHDSAMQIADEWIKRTNEKERVTALEFAAYAAQRSGRPSEANEYYRQLLKLAPNHIAANLNQIQSEIAAEKWTDVEPVIAKLAQHNPDNESILKLYFDVQLNNGDTSASEALIQTHYRQMLDLRSAMLRAYSLFIKKDFVAVIELLDGYVGKIDPPINLLRYYTFSLSSTGQIEKAASTLTSLSKKFPSNSSVSLFLIHMLEGLSQFAEAEKEAARLARAYPNDPRLIIVRANLLVKQQAFKKAKVLLGQFPKELRESNAFKAIMGKVSLGTGDAKGAIALLSDAIAFDKSSDNVMYYAYALAADKRHNEAFDVLRDYLATNPNDIAAIAALADGVKGINPNEAIELYDRILQLDDDNVIALNNSAYLYMQAGDLEESKARVNKALALKTSEPFLIDTAARVHAADDNVSLANSLYQTIVKPNSGIAVLSMYCEYLIDTKQSSEAQHCIDNIKSKFGHNLKQVKVLAQKLEDVM